MTRGPHVSAIIVIRVRVCYLGCGRIRTHDMLIINVGVIDTGTDGETPLV